ncbi:SOS response-associated peptidase [Aquihabitans sp. G128]|uniref:SOS response-associated peptidase n=1 Tax=Aquihabitans sp. G128 TaxID=2849779 RepID=UPI001C216C26|nr:SOS response-associated peptidase [Aquihabitans sp. G128]QXC61994.1 SOS response-associated peptidase [Aquihabitans sp. G128]
MCGRFVSSSPPDEVARYFDAEPPVEDAFVPRYNVAPTDDVFVVLVDGGVRRVAAHHWGLVPFWAKSPAAGARMINARAEGLADKGAFKAAYRARRCIVPADGFYEWQKLEGTKAKQPYFVHRPDHEPLAFAGLWEEWRPSRDSDDVLRSTTIITTTANDAMAAIHDRMPVILAPGSWDRWLDPADADLDTLGRLLVPAPPDVLALRPVGTEVGNVRNQGPQLIAPVEPGDAPGQTSLDLGLGLGLDEPGRG